jgi:hypothetical protein
MEHIEVAPPTTKDHLNSIFTMLQTLGEQIDELGEDGQGNEHSGMFG